MNPKTTFYSIIAAGILFLLPVSAIFVQAVPNATRSALKEERQQKTLTLRKEKAIAEIDRRITALNRVISMINWMKRLTNDQKLSLTSDVQTEITKLQNLKTKINSATDAATLLADKKSIVQDYRTFAFYIPKIRIMVHADKILDLANTLQTKNPVASASAKITDAITQANNAISTVSSLTPSGYPDNKSDIQNAQTMLKTARQDLKDAWVMMKTK